MTDISSRYVLEDRGYESPCWIWQGRTDTNGYGRLGSERVHRLSYGLLRGVISPRRDVHHLCEVRNCINPVHLICVTPQEHSQLHVHFTPELVTALRRAEQFPGQSDWMIQMSLRREIAAKYGVGAGLTYHL